MKRNGYTLEMPLVDIFPEVAEEEERLQGGLYRRRYIPIEEIPAPAIDMESTIDAMRGGNSELIEPMEGEIENKKWEDYTPAPYDLLPFHMTMAAVDEDFEQPRFSSPFSGRAHTKVTYHRGGKMIRLRKETSF